MEGLDSLSEVEDINQNSSKWWFFGKNKDKDK